MKKYSVLCILLFVIFQAPVFAFTLSDTGQDNCYDMDGNVITCPAPGEYLYGQDANYGVAKGKAQPSFSSQTLNDDEVVVDNNTGLMWQQADDGVEREWQDAVDYCSDLDYAGYDDWRLPELFELTTITDYGNYSPALNISVFDGRSSDYWSSTTYPYFTVYAWIVFLFNGHDGRNVKSVDYCVRCVRGGLEIGSFDSLTIQGDDVVKDNATNLMWQKSDSGAEMQWDEALLYCEDLDYAGFDDWRLPDVQELRSIVKYDIYDPAIDTSVFDGGSSYYWTSTTSAHINDSAWFVYFDFGHDGRGGKSDVNYVRCVRSGLNSLFGYLVISRIGSGSGTVESNPSGITCGDVCENFFEEGTVVTLTATPAPGAIFTGWSGDDDCADGMVTINSDKYCTAIFDIESRNVCDLNQDGAFDRTDLIFFIRGCWTGGATWECDQNGDGQLSVMDIIAFAQGCN